MKEMSGEDRTEFAECERLCRIGEVADVVVHELSNALNALALRVAVLQQKAGASLHAELEAVRDQGRVAADWLRQLRHYRTKHRPTRSAVDLNRVVLRAVET